MEFLELDARSSAGIDRMIDQQAVHALPRGPEVERPFTERPPFAAGSPSRTGPWPSGPFRCPSRLLDLQLGGPAAGLRAAAHDLRDLPGDLLPRRAPASTWSWLSVTSPSDGRRGGRLPRRRAFSVARPAGPADHREPAGLDGACRRRRPGILGCWRPLAASKRRKGLWRDSRPPPRALSAEAGFPYSPGRVRPIPLVQGIRGPGTQPIRLLSRRRPVRGNATTDVNTVSPSRTAMCGVW